MSQRQKDLVHFYGALARLEQTIGGRTRLSACHGRMAWPSRGVYFFMEDGETRTGSGEGLRIVRVGTHALKAGSKTSLWKRLSQHRGRAKSGSGNHRSSIFRQIVGTALGPASDYPCWGSKNTPPRDVRVAEHALEQKVSRVIGAMPFIWLAVDDEPGAESLRGVIERNAIALLSNAHGEKADPPSSQWLGLSCSHDKVKASGLWNQNHVNEGYDAGFLEEMERLIEKMRAD